LIDPCIPSDMKGFTVTRHFRNADYHITVDNSAGVEKGIKSITIDGKPMEGEWLKNAVIPTFNDEQVHKIDVTMG